VLKEKKLKTPYGPQKSIDTTFIEIVAVGSF